MGIKNLFRAAKRSPGKTDSPENTHVTAPEEPTCDGNGASVSLASSFTNSREELATVGLMSAG